MGAGFLSEPFIISAIFYSLSIILFWIFFKSTKMPEEKSSNQKN